MANYNIALLHLVFAVILVSGAPSDSESSSTKNIFSSIPHDATTVRNALNDPNGFSREDERVIIDVFAGKLPAKSSYIAGEYKKMFPREDMLKGLREKLSPKVKSFVFASMEYPGDYYSEELFSAMWYNNVPDEDAIVDIFSTFKDLGGWRIANNYENILNESLKEHLEHRTSGDFRNFLVSLLEFSAIGSYVDHNTAVAHAQLLNSADQSHSENFTSLINHIFSRTSDEEIREMILEYERISNRTIADFISGHFSSSARKLLIAIAQRAQSQSDFYARKLRESVDELVNGKVDDASINIYFVTQQYEVRQATLRSFEAIYSRSFESFFPQDEDESFGNYFYALRALIAKTL